MSEGLPRVVIVVVGFGGLAAAKALRRAPARVVLIDRTNHHRFQPLLYQVATAVLTPGQISSPARGILRRQKNATLILGEVTGVDSDRKSVFVDSVDRSPNRTGGPPGQSLLQWIWTYATGRRDSRLIIDHHGSEARNVSAAAPVSPRVDRGVLSART